MLTEKNLEDLLYSALLTNSDKLYKRGFPKLEDSDTKKFRIYRQPDLGCFGRADIVTVEETLDKYNITIIELKQGVLSMDTLKQGYSYVQAIKHIFNEHKNVNIELLLVGSSIALEQRSFNLGHLCSTIDWLYITTYNMDPFKGITFDNIFYDGFDSTFFNSGKIEPSFKFGID